jgi:hypothetical protein
MGSIVKNGNQYEVYFKGKLVGKTNNEDDAWALLAKAKGCAK